MSSAPTIHKNDSRGSERRSCLREPLKWVVLVFFGEDNWGKLIDMSESGMSIEFAHLPPLHQRIDFTFEAMGCMPLPAGGKIFSGSFKTAGKVVWVREFERTAGAKFVDLAEESREQIRRWLFADASIGAVTPRDNAKLEKQAPQSQPFRELSLSSETPVKGNGDASATELEFVDSSTELIAESKPSLAPHSHQETKFDAFQESFEKDLPAEEESESSEPGETKLVANLTQDKVAADDQLWNLKLADTYPERFSYPEPDEQEKPEPAPGLNPRMTRGGFIVVSVFVTALAVLVGARMILSQKTARSEASAQSSSPLADGSKPVSALSRSTVKSPQPFLVEVLDASNRRWLLSFVNNGSKRASNQAVYKSPRPSAPPAPATKAVKREQSTAPAKPQASRQFALEAPKVSSAEANDLTAKAASVAAPALPGEVPAALETPISGIVTNRPIPVPVAGSPVVGGEVQVARLIKSVPPTYPALAKSNHVAGDVTMDALVDPAGNVTDVKVISGPTLLQEAAMAALRQGKYEPDRLDGPPVSFRLNVTVKFRIN